MTSHQERHFLRKFMKLLKRELQQNKREREMGLRDLRWIDHAKLDECDRRATQ